MLKIPFAVQYGKMREKGNYPGPNPGPRGCVVHYTAGHYENGIVDAKRCIDGGIKNGYAYLCIAKTGELLQGHDVLKWGSHCGKSGWQEKLARLAWMLKGDLSDDLIGIEMNNAGRVYKFDGKFYPYWALDEKCKKLIYPKTLTIPESDVRYVGKEWGCIPGYYQKYSEIQEDTLIRTIMWLYVNCEDFKLEYVLGHHECSGLKGIGYWRKPDPGGSLSMPMDIFREYLIDNKKALIAKYGIVKVT